MQSLSWFGTRSEVGDTQWKHNSLPMVSKVNSLIITLCKVKTNHSSDLAQNEVQLP